MDIPSTPKMITCSRCKRQSAVEAAFLKEKHFFGLLTRNYCPDCQLKRQTANVILQYLLLIMLGLLAYFFQPKYWLGDIFLLITIYVVFFIPIVLLHELAHAVVGHLLGFRVFTIMLGAGKTFYTGHFLGVNWDLRPLPVGGATLLGGPPQASYRSRLFAIYLAGPMIHLAIVVASGMTWLILTAFGLSHLMDLFLWVLFWGNLFAFASNIWPRKVSAAFGPSGTDGWYLFNIFSMSAGELEKHYASYYALEALESCRKTDYTQAKTWIEKGTALYPNDLRLLNIAGYVLVQMAEFEPAKKVFLQALESDPQIQPELKYILLNNIAYSDVMLADPALLAEADDFSLQAHQQAPWVPAIVGTRGAVLVALDKVEEGLPLLKSAMGKNPDKRGKALDACFIARGAYRRGDRAEAEKYLASARMLDPKCILIDKVSSEISTSAGQMSQAGGTAFPDPPLIREG